MIKLHCLIKSVTYKHFCKIQSICMRKIFIDNDELHAFKQSEHLQDVIYNNDDC